MDRPTWGGIWHDDKAAILRGLGEHPIPGGARAYVDFHLEWGGVPEAEALELAAMAEEHLRDCWPKTVPSSQEPAVSRRGTVVRLTYRKPEGLGELDIYLPFCLSPDPPWAHGAMLVEFGEVLPWWRYPVPGWAAAIGAVLAGSVVWSVARRGGLVMG